MRRRPFDLRRPARRRWLSNVWVWLVAAGLGVLLLLVVLSREKLPRSDPPLVRQVGSRPMIFRLDALAVMKKKETKKPMLYWIALLYWSYEFGEIWIRDLFFVFLIPWSFHCSDPMNTPLLQIAVHLSFGR
ncbi:hypothetical protein BHE74_00015137 [Ensete ventricosum]|nr:hypothetical protein GW17_00000992 [Ensete ventricosum]RWW76750.1 hypothetical protein BHE74_00015137 [Ensete ventricosum]RZR79845.1 hypothetical protein BHM03_00005695 [Ensete ventricosum]